MAIFWVYLDQLVIPHMHIKLWRLLASWSKLTRKHALNTFKLSEDWKTKTTFKKAGIHIFITNLSWDCHWNHFTQTFCVQLVESVISSVQNDNISKFTQLLMFTVIITLQSLKQKHETKENKHKHTYKSTNTISTTRVTEKNGKNMGTPCTGALCPYSCSTSWCLEKANEYQWGQLASCLIYS